MVAKRVGRFVEKGARPRQRRIVLVSDPVVLRREYPPLEKRRKTKTGVSSGAGDDTYYGKLTIKKEGEEMHQTTGSEKNTLGPGK